MSGAGMSRAVCGSELPLFCRGVGGEGEVAALTSSLIHALYPGGLTPSWMMLAVMSTAMQMGDTYFQV